MSGGALESEIFGSEDEGDEDDEDDEDYVGAHQDSDDDWRPAPEEEVVGDTPEMFTQDQDMNDSQEPEVAVVVDGHTNEDQIDYTHAAENGVRRHDLERPAERLPEGDPDGHVGTARPKFY